MANSGHKGDWVFKIAELSATCVKMKKFSVSFGIKVHVIQSCNTKHALSHTTLFKATGWLSLCHAVGQVGIGEQG